MFVSLCRLPDRLPGLLLDYLPCRLLDRRPSHRCRLRHPDRLPGSLAGVVVVVCVVAVVVVAEVVGVVAVVPVAGIAGVVVVVGVVVVGETTVGALYNSMPDIEDALHAAGWVMLNIVFPGISFGDNVMSRWQNRCSHG